MLEGIKQNLAENYNSAVEKINSHVSDSVEGRVTKAISAIAAGVFALFATAFQELKAGANWVKDTVWHYAPNAITDKLESLYKMIGSTEPANLGS